MDDIELAACDVVRKYIKALNSRDLCGLSSSLHFPHIRIMNDGSHREWATPSEYLAEFLSRLAVDDWASTRLLTLETKIISPQKCHTSITFERLRINGSVISTYQSLYLITWKDDRWGILLGSGTG